MDKLATPDTERTKVTVWVTPEELRKLDAAIVESGYKSRAEWFRDMARRTVKGQV